jgi:Transposase, Mutator family.
MRKLLLMHTILQALIAAEEAEHIGADPHERTDARTTYRNGTRTRRCPRPVGT